MGWSNIGSVAITATSVILVDSNGNQVGSLDGLFGLILIGDGTANQPDMILSPQGDLIWIGGLDPNLTDAMGIHVGAFNNGTLKHFLGMQIGSGSLSNQQEAYCVPCSAPSDGSSPAGVMMVPFAVGQDQFGVSGSPFTWPESWHALTLQNGWSAVPGLDVPACRNMPDGTILLRGTMQGGTTAVNTIIANLPVHYRPDNTIVLNTNSNGASALAAIGILANGDIRIASLFGATLFSLDGMRFPIAALT